MKISDTKRKFLENLGVDINNLPIDFKKFNNSYEKNVKSKEKSFLSLQAPKFTSIFCMRDIVGTQHPDYENMTFFESFIASKRGDDIIAAYNNNPSYYCYTLKQSDQISEKCKHDTPLVLYKTGDGKYYIAGGNNRLSLMMMLYLSDLSKAKTEEERKLVYQKHTYYAVIKSIPKNKKIVNVIALLIETYSNIKFEFMGNSPDDCIYNVDISGTKYHVNNYEELYGLLKDAYSLSNVKNKSDLIRVLDELFYNLNVSAYGDKVDLDLINGIFPKLDELQEIYIKAKTYDVFDQISYSNLGYDNLLKQLKNIVSIFEEEMNREKVSKAKKYFIDCKNMGDFVSRMDDLIEHRNFNAFEIVFDEVISSYQDFKKMFLEIREYLIENYNVSFLFSYDNIYDYITKVVADKRKKDYDLNAQTLKTYEEDLFELKKKLAIIKNGPFYLDVSYQICSLNNKKDNCEQMINKAQEKKSVLLERMSNNSYRQEKIKNKNPILRLFYRKKLKLLKQESIYLNVNLDQIREEISSIENKKQTILNSILERKKRFSDHIGFGITFDDFKLEEDKVKENYKPDYIIEKEIFSLQRNITELSMKLSKDKIEFNKFCEEHGINDLYKKSDTQNLS